MASSALLQTIRERQGAVADVGTEGGGAPASRVDAVASALLAKMAGFFRARGGRATSAQLVSQFKRECPNAVLFKTMLRELAAQDDGGSKCWVLKPEFADASDGQ